MEDTDWSRIKSRLEMDAGDNSIYNLKNDYRNLINETFVKEPLKKQIKTFLYDCEQEKKINKVWYTKDYSLEDKELLEYAELAVTIRDLLMQKAISLAEADGNDTR